MAKVHWKGNHVTFYFRNEFKPDFDKFYDLVRKDKRIKLLMEQRDREKGKKTKIPGGELSFVFSQLILAYNDDHSDVEVEPEASEDSYNITNNNNNANSEEDNINSEEDNSNQENE